jgi:hypothetical protein
MDGFPNAEVEGYLHPRLHLVVRLRYFDLDGDPVRVRLDVADVRDALGAPKKAEEFLGEVWIAQSDVHSLALSATPGARTSLDLPVRLPG